MKLFFQFSVDVVEDDALPSERVDGLSELLVVGDGFIELLVRLVEPVLEDLDLLADL